MHTRKCPFKGCTKKIQETRFACPTHWYTLNWKQRNRIYNAYDRFMSGNIGIGELRKIQHEVLKEVDAL